MRNEFGRSRWRLRPGPMGGALRRLRQMLPAQARRRRNRRAAPHQRRLPVLDLPAGAAATTTPQGACPGLRAAQHRPSVGDRLAALDLRLSPARRRQALFDWHYLVSGDRDTVHGPALGARLDGDRGRGRRARGSIWSTVSSEALIRRYRGNFARVRRGRGGSGSASTRCSLQGCTDHSAPVPHRRHALAWAAEQQGWIAERILPPCRRLR